MWLPSEDRNYITKTRMYENIVSLMGGRVAEELVLEDITTGASDDFRRATETARNMVTRYGFSENIGPVVYGSNQGEVFLGRDYTSHKDYSEEVASAIDKEVRSLVEKAYKHTTQILGDNIDKMHVVAKYLFEHEKIDSDEFLGLMEGRITVDHDPFERIGKEPAEEEQPAGQVSEPPDQPPIQEGPKMDGQEIENEMRGKENSDDAP